MSNNSIFVIGLVLMLGVVILAADNFNYQPHHHPANSGRNLNERQNSFDFSATQGVPFEPNINPMNRERPRMRERETGQDSQFSNARFKDRNVPLADSPMATESMWTRMLRHLPENQLMKLHETKCLLESIDQLEREGFLFMTPEATKWRRKQALRELEYILSQPMSARGNDNFNTRTVVTEDMLRELELSDFFFRFKGVEPSFESNFPGDLSPTSPSFRTNGVIPGTRASVEMEAEFQNRRNTSEDSFVVQAQFSDGSFVTFLNTKWMEALMIFIVIMTTIANNLLLPKLSLGEWDSKRIKSFVFTSSFVCPVVMRIILPNQTERGVSELFTIISIIGMLQVYVQTAAPLPRNTSDRGMWERWKGRGLSETLHYCSCIWTWVAVLFHSYLIGSAAVLSIATTMVSDDVGLIDSLLSTKLRQLTRIEPQLFQLIYPRKSVMANEGERDVVPNLLVSSLNLLLMYTVCILVRKVLGVPYLLVLERPFIFFCCVLYYGTALVASTKWYMHRKASVRQKGPPVHSEEQITQMSEQILSTKKEETTLRHIVKDTPPTASTSRTAASAASSFSEEPRAHTGRTKKSGKENWNEIYMRTNLVAVGSSSFFLLIAYFFHVNFLFTLTGYFIILLIHTKYFETFWKRENMVWVMLGWVAIMYGSYLIIRSLPALYNPVEKLIEYSWILLNW